MNAPLPLAWLPVHPDVHAELAAIKASPDPQTRWPRIVALAAHQLDYMEIGLLDRYAGAALAERFEPAGVQRIRLAWLGSSTLDHLLPSTRIAGLRRGLLVDSYLAPYGQYRQELADPASGLAAFQPHVVLLSLDPEHAAVEAPLDASDADVEAQVQHQVADHQDPLAGEPPGQLPRAFKTDHGHNASFWVSCGRLQKSPPDGRCPSQAPRYSTST